MKTETICLVIFAFFCCAGVEASVSKCYYCAGSCKDPLETQDCPKDGIEYSCITSTVEGGGVTAETKGCVPTDNSQIKQACDLTDSQSGGTCSICDEDLCNSAGIYSISVILLVGLFMIIKVL